MMITNSYTQSGLPYQQQTWIRTMNETEITLEDIFNQEIVRESLREVTDAVDDALVEKIWTLCEGNPWNAVPLYKILKTVGKV